MLVCLFVCLNASVVPVQKRMGSPSAGFSVSDASTETPINFTEYTMWQLGGTIGGWPASPYACSEWKVRRPSRWTEIKRHEQREGVYHGKRTHHERRANYVCFFVQVQGLHRFLEPVWHLAASQGETEHTLTEHLPSDDETK